jgi:uncharacterized membrane-anchored protein YjiN (DUF445 family)
MEWDAIYFGDAVATYQWLIQAAEAFTEAEDEDAAWFDSLDAYTAALTAAVKSAGCLPDWFAVNALAKKSLE